jgi:hypothetical protein
MKDERVPEKALKGYIEGRRTVGRPRRRWMDAMGRTPFTHSVGGWLGPQRLSGISDVCKW